MNLAKMRTQLAETLDRLSGVKAGHEFAPTAVQAGDAWPVLRFIEPATFATYTATWDLLVVLAEDDESAFTAFDELAVTVLDALGEAGFNPQSVTPQLIEGSGMRALVATVLTEVEH
jgi:hypothetical protein